MAVWVRVGRRGRRRDGPIALLLRAVLISPRDGVVGGRSVLKKRFAVHHLSRRNASSSCLVLCRKLNSSATEKKGSKPNSGYFAPVAPEAERRWLTRSGDKNKENKEKTLRKNETSSLSMRQLCPRRRNNPKYLPNVHFKDRNGLNGSGNG